MLADPGGVNQLTQQALGAAIRVHREFGPGLLEFTYAAPEKRGNGGETEKTRAKPSAGLRARAPAEGRRLGGEGSGGRKPLELLIGLGPPLASPPRPRYRAARALTGHASTPNLPTSPS